jgi:hypothetical protein
MDDPSDPPRPADHEDSVGAEGGRTPTLGDFFWLGTGCAVSVVAGGAIGYGLDGWLGTTPWLSFAGLAFGIVSSVMLVVAQMRKFT